MASVIFLSLSCSQLSEILPIPEEDIIRLFLNVSLSCESKLCWFQGATLFFFNSVMILSSVYIL